MPRGPHPSVGAVKPTLELMADQFPRQATSALKKSSIRLVWSRSKPALR